MKGCLWEGMLVGRDVCVKGCLWEGMFVGRDVCGKGCLWEGMFVCWAESGVGLPGMRRGGSAAAVAPGVDDRPIGRLPPLMRLYAQPSLVAIAKPLLGRPLEEPQKQRVESCERGGLMR